MAEQLHPTDWRVVTAEFAQRFPEDRDFRGVTRQLFGGGDGSHPSVNFMTPEWLGYVADPDGTPVEVSTGTGLTGNRIYGVTWPTIDGRTDPRSTLVHSLDEVADVIAGKT